MIKQVTICTAGECGGECYRCRLVKANAERTRFAVLLLDLFDREVARGYWGPFCDDWDTAAGGAWPAFWSDADALKTELEPHQTQATP